MKIKIVTDKWGLQYGVHSGTKASRDNRYYEYDTLDKLIEDYNRLESNRIRSNRLILNYAILVYPCGRQKVLQKGGGEPSVW